MEYQEYINLSLDSAAPLKVIMCGNVQHIRLSQYPKVICKVILFLIKKKGVVENVP